ncbi:unnamed protein product, partial [Urochloa humidicola]
DQVIGRGCQVAIHVTSPRAVPSPDGSWNGDDLEGRDLKHVPAPPFL